MNNVERNNSLFHSRQSRSLSQAGVLQFSITQAIFCRIVF